MKTETKEAIETVFQAACTGFLVAEARAPSPDRERFKAVADALHIAWPEIVTAYVQRTLGPIPGENPPPSKLKGNCDLDAGKPYPKTCPVCGLGPCTRR